MKAVPVLEIRLRQKKTNSNVNDIELIYLFTSTFKLYYFSGFFSAAA